MVEKAVEQHDEPDGGSVDGRPALAGCRGVRQSRYANEQKGEWSTELLAAS